MSCRWVKLGALVCLITFVGCAAPDPGTPALPSITLHLLMPDALAGHALRLEHLMERAVRLELDYASKGGVQDEESFPTGDWNQIGLPELAFPRDEKDVLTVEARIWDRTKEGRERGYPVLSGQVKLKAAEMPRDSSEVPLKLVLRVPARDFD